MRLEIPGGSGIYIFLGMVTEDFTEKKMFEQRLEGGDRQRGHVGRAHPGACKGHQ